LDLLHIDHQLEEKQYAVGKIPGSFLRREGRPGEHATLTARLIDLLNLNLIFLFVRLLDLLHIDHQLYQHILLRLDHQMEYQVGKIPGSFLRREGRPGEHATLTARLIDRPIRPMFSDGIIQTN